MPFEAPCSQSRTRITPVAAALLAPVSTGSKIGSHTCDVGARRIQSIGRRTSLNALPSGRRSKRQPAMSPSRFVANCRRGVAYPALPIESAVEIGVFSGHAPTHAVRPNSSVKICSCGKNKSCACAGIAVAIDASIAAIVQLVDCKSITWSSCVEETGTLTKRLVRSSRGSIMTGV